MNNMNMNDISMNNMGKNKIKNIKFISENLVSNPAFSGTGNQPEGWIFESPRPELAPEYHLHEYDENNRRLVISSKNDIYSFGCWSSQINLEVGQWYYASVRVKIKDIASPDLSICAHFAQHFLVPEENKWEEDTLLSQVFKYNSSYEGNKIELYLRCAEKGSIEWYDPFIAKIEAPKQRIVRVATVRFSSDISAQSLTLEEHRERISDKLSQAGSLKPDITVLPEFTPVIGVSKENYKSYFDAAESVPDGETCKILSEAASKYNMYVIAGIIEKRGNYMFNTAVIFDRKGNFIGQYDKTHLTFGELKEGFSCGKDYPLFDLDFGRVGIHICYDEWFPEVSRYYAYNGAEILFLPVAGGKPITWRTRALDNGIYFISSSINPPSMIIDSSGAIIAETHDDGIAFADLNLDYRKTNWYIDPTLVYGMPCIIPQMRNTIDNKLIESFIKK